MIVYPSLNPTGRKDGPRFLDGTKECQTHAKACDGSVIQHTQSVTDVGCINLAVTTKSALRRSSRVLFGVRTRA